MKSFYFVNYGIFENTDKRGQPICLNSQEITEVVRPLALDIKKVIRDDKISIISSNGKKHHQAARIVSRYLGVEPIFRNTPNDNLGSILQIIPTHRNQIVLLGIGQIERVLDSFISQGAVDIIHNCQNITDDRQFCPYEVWKLDITQKNFKQTKPLFVV